MPKRDNGGDVQTGRSVSVGEDDEGEMKIVIDTGELLNDVFTTAVGVAVGGAVTRLFYKDD